MSESNSKFSRRKPKNQFTQVPNELIRSKMKNASFRLICYLESHDEGWIIYKEVIKKDLGWGREILDTAIKELINMKLLIVHPQRNEKGRFTHNDYEFSFFPIEEQANENSNNFTVNGFPVDGLAGCGKPSTKNTNIKNTNDKNTSDSSPSPKNSSSTKSHCHSVHSEKTVPIEKEKEDKDRPIKEEILRLNFPGMRSDTLGFLSKVNSLSKIQDSLKKYFNARKKIKKCSNPIGLFRSILAGDIQGIVGSLGMSNKEWAIQFLKNTKIKAQFHEKYIKNLSTEDEISFEINSEDFKWALESWRDVYV